MTGYVPELFKHRVLHRTGILPAHLVVGNPAVLRGGFAVGAQVGVAVDRRTWVVVLHPAQVAKVADVDVEALEADAGGDDSVEFSGLDLGVHEAVAQGRQVEGSGLAGGDDAVALYAGEVAPHGGGEEITGDVFAGEVLQKTGALVLRGGLGAFERGFGVFHSRLERFELFGADAMDADADGGLLADDELILCFVPLAAAVAGEGAGADGFAADAQGRAAGDELAVEAQFGVRWMLDGRRFIQGFSAFTSD